MNCMQIGLNVSAALKMFSVCLAEFADAVPLRAFQSVVPSVCAVIILQALFLGSAGCSPCLPLDAKSAGFLQCS